MTSKRLLLIALHYGPQCATGGFRWNAMVRHLGDRGWTFDIVTWKRYWNLGPGAEGDLRRARIIPVALPTWPDAVVRTVSRTKRRFVGAGGARPDGAAAESDASRGGFPYPRPAGAMYRRVTSLLDGLRWTYPEIVWARRATRAARRLCRAEAYHAIIVSSPPHISHLVGLSIQREFGIPFLADFRDLWKAGTGEYDRLDSLSRWLAGRYEALVFRDAHTIIFNTDLAGQTMTDGNLIGGSAVAISNGFDANGRPERPDDGTFRIVLTGQFYPFSDLEAFFAGCRRVRGRLDASRESMRVEFVGTPATHRGVPLEDIARFYGLQDAFSSHGRVTREEAARLQRSAAVLVAFDQGSRPAIPVKFYDYAQTFGTMLLFGDPRSDLAIAAAKLGVRLCGPQNEAGIDTVLKSALDRWRRRDFDRVTDPEGIFDRVHQSQKLHELLSTL